MRKYKRDSFKESFFRSKVFLAEVKRLLDEKYGQNEWWAWNHNCGDHKVVVPNTITIQSWPSTLKKACENLNRADMWEYWNELPYYESDDVDDMIVGYLLGQN